MRPLRLVFAGSPAAAVPSLEALLASEHELAAVVTREDSPQGRKRVLTSTPVAVAAEAAGVRVIRANRLAAAADEIAALEAELGVVVAYGGLVREPLLSAPEHGWINLHFSLLPRWRGAAPVQRAIIAGDSETGVSVFRLVDELDAGPLLATAPHPIGRHATAGQLLDQLAVFGAKVLVDAVDALARGEAEARTQSGAPSFAPKLSLDDGRLDWSQSATGLDARIRGVTPEPGAFTLVDGERLKVHDATIAHGAARLSPGQLAPRGRSLHIGTADEPLELVTVQPAGKRAMAAMDWWRGRGSDAAVAE